jgi:hypothetical protein
VWKAADPEGARDREHRRVTINKQLAQLDSSGTVSLLDA